MKKKVGLVCIIAVMILTAGGCSGAEDAGETYLQEEKLQEADLRKTENEEETGNEEETENEEETGNEVKTENEVETEYKEETNAAEEIGKPDNCRLFFSMAEKQGLNKEETAEFLQVLMEDNVFSDDNMKITGLIIDDMDGNNQKDMLVMVLDAEDTPFYGSGCLWFYMNDDEPYCFNEEDCSYYGWFDAFWADIDNDENVEIVFSAQGTGCGAAGDSYKAVFKYRDHELERMELPSDFDDDYDCGINVEVTREVRKNSYSAYCPCLDKTISFESENAYDEQYSLQPVVVGGNVRGYFDLRCVEYNGKNALQASEYLNGEGGIVQGVGTAEFIIVWDESGEPRIDKFWVESW